MMDAFSDSSSRDSSALSPIRIGPAGWSYEDWKGIVYPNGMKEHPLHWLQQAFDAVELNVTFYRPPVARNCARWVGLVERSPDFRFTAKLWQRFTHDRNVFPEPHEIAMVQEGFEPLVEAGRLGALLIQFPWSFRRTPENRQWLANTLDAFADYPRVVELRHASWDRPEVYEAFAERGIGFCNIDQPLFRDSIAPSKHVTARVGYVRLHGRNAADWFREDAGRNDRYDYLYNTQELAEWVQKIEQMRPQVNDLYVISNNHYRGQAIVNALELRHALGQGVRAVPQTLVEHYPRLAPLADS